MRFALLGNDPDAIALARSAATSDRHSLVWAAEAGDELGRLVQMAPVMELGTTWEALLTGDVADAVIIGRGEDDEQRAEHLRKLIQQDIPLLVTHPIHDSMLIYYELEMIRQSSRSPMLPYLPARWHPAVQDLFELLSSGEDAELGTLEQVVFERQMPNRSEVAVKRQFSRDVDLVRAVCGEITHVGAMIPQGARDGYANLGVQLSGPASVLVRWSVGPVESMAGGNLLLVGSRAKASIIIPEPPAAWTLEVRRGGEIIRSQSYLAWNGATAALDRMADRVAGSDEPSQWIDACRAVELSETIQRSLAKGRTVELYNEDYTEEGTFKGTMASVGCGLLLLALFVLVLGTLAVRFGMPLADKWPFVMLFVLVGFLLLQLLQLVFPRRGTE